MDHNFINGPMGQLGAWPPSLISQKIEDEKSLAHRNVRHTKKEKLPRAPENPPASSQT